MTVADLRRAPAVVVVFPLLTAAGVAYGLSRSPRLFHHPVDAALVIALLVLWVAAVVLWRQRWAWALMLLASLSGVLAPIWAEWHGPLIYGFNVATACLLLTPGMRQYMGVHWWRHDAPRA